ncbi:hypothetical protein HDU93_002371 [Gonapodya sp. JEL0774]|nr:hypothetical protein HDU93_002371 [Gonapodya sp. JEL0774]
MSSHSISSYAIPIAASVTAGIATLCYVYYDYPQVKEPDVITTNSKFITIRDGTIKLRVVQIGLGGQVTQFASQIAYISTKLQHPVLAIDNVGHGLSSRPSDYPSYRTSQIVKDTVESIKIAYGSRADKGIVLVGHSYGTVVASWVAAELDAWVKGVVKAVVLIGPGKPLNKETQARLSTISYFPTILIDLWRLYDRRGGAASASVTRFVSAQASPEVRAKQLEWNLSSRTDTLKRIVAGMDWAEKGVYERMAGVGATVVIAVGEEDRVTPLEGAEVVKGVVVGADGKVGDIVVLKGSGHNSMVDAADQVNAVLDELLAKL